MNKHLTTRVAAYSVKSLFASKLLVHLNYLLHMSFSDQDVHVAFTNVTDSLPYEVFTGIISNQSRFFQTSQGFSPTQCVS